MRLPYADPALRRVLLQDPAIADALAYYARVEPAPVTVLVTPAAPVPAPSAPREAVSIGHEWSHAFNDRPLSQRWAPTARFYAPDGELLDWAKAAIDVSTTDTRERLELTLTLAQSCGFAGGPVEVGWVVLGDGEITLKVDRMADAGWRLVEFPITSRPTFSLFRGYRLLPCTADAPVYRQWQRVAGLLHRRAGGVPRWRALHAI